MAFRMVNTTPAFTRGGCIRALSVAHDPQLKCAVNDPTHMHPTTLADVLSLLESHKDVRMYSTEDFITTKRFVVAPAGFSAYHSWTPEVDWTQFQDNHWHAFGEAGAASAMYVNYFLFEAPASTQSYTFIFDAQDGCRFPVGSALSNMARSAPQGDAARVRAIHNDLTNQAGDAHPTLWQRVVNVGDTLMRGLERISTVAGTVAGAYATARGVPSLGPPGSTPLVTALGSFPVPRRDRMMIAAP
jgi:hypothetical protein